MRAVIFAMALAGAAAAQAPAPPAQPPGASAAVSPAPASPPVPAQVPAPAAVPAAPVVQMAPAQLLALLRAGGLVVYFRHTATDFSRDDSKMRDFDDCANQRLLTPKGRADARAIGAEWKRLKIPVGRVLASPYCRTRDVAQQMFGRHERTPEARGGPVSPDSDRYAGLKGLLSTPIAEKTNLVISSHGNPYYATNGPPYLVEGEGVVIRPQGDGRWEVLARLRGDEWAKLR